MKTLAIVGMLATYAYVLAFLAAAGYAHPFLEQPGDCARACQEARTLLAQDVYAFGFILACIANILCVMLYAIRSKR